MEEKFKALSKEEQHTLSRVLKKVACVARKFDQNVLKKPAAYIAGRGVDDDKPTNDAQASAGTHTPADSPKPSNFMPHPRPQLKLGILRLDYNYEAAPGDIDYPKSFKYKVTYRNLEC